MAEGKTRQRGIVARPHSLGVNLRARRGERMMTVRRLIAALAAAGVALLGSAAFAGVAAASTSSVPYTDPDAVGSIGLCNQAGQQITSGSVTAKPFAWRAVSTAPAQAPYNNAGRTATLVVFQPQQALPAGDWSGAEITSSSTYSDPANPMAAATAADQSLADFIAQYPPKWDGLLQVRMYLSTANEQADNVYPALNIQVTGNTWQAVGGSPVNSASGTAESIESVVLPTTTTTSPTTTGPTTITSASGTVASPGSDTGVSTDKRGPGGSGKAASVALASRGGATSSSGNSSDLPLLVLVIIVLAALAVLVGATVLVRRRRLAIHSPSDSSPDRSSPPTKGNPQ